MGELLLIALGLSMDALAAAVSKGMAVREMTCAQALKIGAWFGVFQAGMPLIGFAVGSRFSMHIVRYDHWIALLLLGYLGVRMICEAGEEMKTDEALNAKSLFPLAVATSVDALAAGVTFAFLQTDIWRAAGLIGACTWALSFAGAWLGKALGRRSQRTAAYAGGGILIGMGIKILLEHVGVL